jgi:hypothetical protein
MTPGDVLVALAEAGAALWAEGDALRFRAPPGALSADLRAAAGGCRSALVALVRSGGCLPADVRRWPETWRDAFEERAGILQFEAGRPRELAERDAERLVRVDHAHDFVVRTKLVVTPGGAVATARPGSGPCR